MTLPIPDDHLVFVCRYCTKLAEMWDKGEKVCHLQCGGPKKGMTFPLYQGPMTWSYLRDHCYVCGDPAEVRVEIGLQQRDLGVCKKHLPFAVGAKVVEDK